MSPFTSPAGRFLSQAECIALAARVERFARGGGNTDLFLDSTWMGNLRWARNQISTSGDIRDNDVGVVRTIRGATSRVTTNQLADVYLEAAVRRAERLLLQQPEQLNAPFDVPYTESYQVPPVWFDRTYHLDAEARMEVMRHVVRPAEQAGMLSAGYLQVFAVGRAVMNTTGRNIYIPFTQAQYSVTVRDPQGTASGWAGVDWNHWGRIDAESLSAIALEKCLASRNPVAIEPGRYTTIFEPQAISDLIAPLFDGHLFDRNETEKQSNGPLPFSSQHQGATKLGERVIDERLTISTDPMDSDLAFVPVALRGQTERDLPVFHPVTWIDHGVLTALAYAREPYGVEVLGVNTGLPAQGAFKMSGGTTSVAEMIATTTRGLLVTRLDDVHIIEKASTLAVGHTRDGVWLIEHGQISKSVKNLFFTEAILVALNSVLQLGPPQRVFRPSAPTVVPPLKIADFDFTALTETV